MIDKKKVLLEAFNRGLMCGGDSFLNAKDAEHAIKKLVDMHSELTASECRIVINIDDNTDNTNSLIYLVARSYENVLSSVLSEISASGATFSSVSHCVSDGNFYARIIGKKLHVKDQSVIITRLKNLISAFECICADEFKIKEKLSEVSKYISTSTQDSDSEAKKFIEWVSSCSNFRCLAYIKYDFVRSDSNECIQPIRKDEYALGMARMAGQDSFPGPHMLPAEIRNMLTDKRNIINVSKSDRISLISPRRYMDCIGIKIFDEKGSVIGEEKYLGLFSYEIYNCDLESIPIVRKKIKFLKDKAMEVGGPVLADELKSNARYLSRIELMQQEDSCVFDSCMAIKRASLRLRPTLVFNVERFERFANCMAIFPANDFSSAIGDKTAYLAQRVLNGRFLSKSLALTENDLVVIQFEFKTVPGCVPDTKIKEIQKEFSKITTSWQQELSDKVNVLLPDAGSAFVSMIKNVFPPGYTDRFSTDEAIEDIVKINDIIGASQKQKTVAAKPECIKVCSRYKPDVSTMFRILENMGIRIKEHTHYKISAGREVVWLDRFVIEFIGNESKKIEASAACEEAISRIFSGELVDDPHNKLLATGSFKWRDVQLVRALTSYLKQLVFVYGQDIVRDILVNNPVLTKQLVDLFYARMNPNIKSDVNSKKISKYIDDEIIAKIQSVTENRVAFTLKNIINGISRTNFFHPDRTDISFKIDPNDIKEVPLPKPFAEIYVYSNDFEGIHLRGGKVARGGLRWSDRPEDYRTEVLGLMRAQVKKNTFIVPTGSKGGFVLKNVPADREDLNKYAISCYERFLCGMLDLTDNIVNGKIVPPPFVRRRDGDDPYLVVAADKGTASFSDYANSISEKYSFWLGDAFASGGSSGYDHKKMAITSSGAWISAKHHLNKVGIDPDKSHFTVVGIGDMSGDVFGNGMLMSRNIKLVAAFNHRHIFIDPSPDPEKSYQERLNLFEKPRSNWSDYKTSLISDGGNIYDRRSITIDLSPQAREILNTKVKSCSPDECIRIILSAPVDLIWNGGIGTYVKAESETNADVEDKSNDACRVNGKNVRAKVFVEGGNLGVTPKGRVEYSDHGGKINADFIDNSAGVSCSDHEVNIKICFAELLRKNRLSLLERNALLSAMQKEVAKIVLKDNEEQNFSLTISEMNSRFTVEQDRHRIARLDEDRYFNRHLENFPSDSEMKKMSVSSVGLSRSLIATLMSYSKIAIRDSLIGSDFSSDPYLRKYLLEYFPKEMRDKFSKDLLSHPLKEEIVLSYLCNSIVNRMGSNFLFNVRETANVSHKDVVISYVVVRDIYDIESMWKELEQSFVDISKNIFFSAIREIQLFSEHSCCWLSRSFSRGMRASKIINEMESKTRQLIKIIPDALPSTMSILIEKKTSSWIAGGMDKKLAARIAALNKNMYAMDIVLICKKTKIASDIVSKLYFKAAEITKADWLYMMLTRKTCASYWERLMIKTIIFEIRHKKAEITHEMITILKRDKLSVNDTVEAWCKEKGHVFVKYRKFISDVQKRETASSEMLTVLANRMKLL